jgi:nitroreductase
MDSSCDKTAFQIIRQRRSAVAMDGVTRMERSVFYRLLSRLQPDLNTLPFNSLNWKPAVSLALFVHRVDEIPAGLYLLVRDSAHEASLRQSLSDEFVWQKPQHCPDDLRLYLLVQQDVKQAAQAISCHQEIAAEGVFSLGMLAHYRETLANQGAHFYPRLYWECGAIGQLLYLEAEAVGLRGTGIGCFFDDVMHQVLGITDDSWQSLYHFTLGGPLEDERLQTEPAYKHLP